MYIVSKEKCVKNYLLSLVEELRILRKAVKLNITVRQSRQSGVARATCPD